MEVFMKKILLAVSVLLVLQNIIFAQNDVNYMNKNELTVLTEGEAFQYPLNEGDIIECYAKRIDGSIDKFLEYNDYFIVKDGNLYSNTLNRMYKPKLADKLKKVDRVKLTDNNKTLQMYDPLWSKPGRRHIRIVKIEPATGKYFMKAAQDNWTWYRNAIATGYCRVIYNDKK